MTRYPRAMERRSDNRPEAAARGSRKPILTVCETWIKLFDTGGRGSYVGFAGHNYDCDPHGLRLPLVLVL